MRINQITDLEQMRQVARLLEAENDRLHKRLEAMVSQLAALQGKSGSELLQLELLKLQEQMAALQRRMFGPVLGEKPARRGAKDQKAPARTWAQSAAAAAHHRAAVRASPVRPDLH